MTNSLFGYDSGTFGIGADPYRYGQQNFYDRQNYGLNQNYGQNFPGQQNGPGSLFGGAPASSGNKLFDALNILSGILAQVGNIAIGAAYARNAGRGAFGGGYAGFNPYASPYQAFNGAGFGARGFGYNGGGAYPSNFGQPGYGFNSFSSV